LGLFRCATFSEWYWGEFAVNENRTRRYHVVIKVYGAVLVWKELPYVT